MTEIRMKTVSDWVGFCFYSSEVLIALCCLSFALVLIAKQRKKKVSDILVMHLCGCELVTMIFKYCINCLYYWNKIDKRSDTWYMPLYTALYVSVYQSVLLIVVDRVLAVYLVLKYKAVVTKKKLVIIYIIMWSISIATGVTRYFIARSVWLFWDNTSIIVIASSYSYIIIAVYRRRRAMNKNTLQQTAPPLKFQIPLFIICSFILTFLTPDLVVIFNPELYCIWFQVIWTLNWISDPLVYVIFTKLQHKKDRKRSTIIYKNAQTSQRNSRVSVITICDSSTDHIAAIE